MLNSIAFIPDGNRRYAQKGDISLEQSYTKGFDKAEEVLNWCLEIPSLKNIIMYGLSHENLQRDKLQLTVLFALYKRYLRKIADSEEVKQHQINVKVVGDNEYLKEFENEIKYLEEKTKDYSKKTLYIALAYSARKELFKAIKESDLEEDVLKKLQVPFEADLIVRTSGRQRLSNFLLWQSAYSELYFVKSLWPEFSKQEFEDAVVFFEETQRNLGK